MEIGLDVNYFIKKYGLTRQALIAPIKKGRLKAKKSNGKWMIIEDDYHEYKRNRYNRNLTKVNNKLVFDKSKGLYSVTEASKIIGCDPQRIYNHLRYGIIPSKRVRKSWVIHIDDINSYKSKLMIKKTNSRESFERMPHLKRIIKIA